MTFFIVLFVLLMQFLWRYVDDLVGKGLDFKILAEMMFYASFALLPMAFPLAMLLASIMTFGSLGENYELVAIKASGISLFRIMRPLIVIAVMVTCFAFYLSNEVLPKTNLKFSTLLSSVKKQRPELVLQDGIFTNEIDGYSIKVGRKDNKTKILYDLLIYDHTDGKINKSVTVADSGLLKVTEDKKYMVLTLYNGETYEEQKEESKKRKKAETYPYQRRSFDEQIIRVPVKGFDFERKDEDGFRKAYKMLNISQLLYMEDSLGMQFHEKLAKYMLQLRFNTSITKKMYNLTVLDDSLRRNVVVQAPDTIFNFDTCFAAVNNIEKAAITKAALKKARDNMQQINMNQGQLYDRKKWLNKYMMERYKKFTWSFAILIFFFIGAPLGAIIRKGGLGMPVVVSIFLFILYYIVSMSGEKTAREDVWGMFNGMWFSSYIFLPIGIWLSYKAATDSALMSSETYTKIIDKLGIDKLFPKKESKKNSK
jgi:lipopolysaccharide export system permease protein